MSGRDGTFGELIEALRQPEAHSPAAQSPVSVIQTHISGLVFVDDRVYKIKKPVDLGFVDYSTPEKRRHFCEEEVRLNSRLSPDVYRGVRRITRNSSGTIEVEGGGETVDYAVEMVRLPHDRLMNNLLARGEIDNTMLDAIVDLLVEFHRSAPTGDGIDRYGEADEISAQLEDNLSGLDPFIALEDAEECATLTANLRDQLGAYARSWINRHRALFKQRISAGRIRDGHGDLHAGNICFWDDTIIIYDCIEFSERFRCRDVACEMAFLATDLDYRCFRGFAGYLLRRYAEQTGDHGLPRVAHFYKVHLAIVRGKVASIRAQDENLDRAERDESRVEAMRYFQLAATYTLPPVLIMMCGLPGTGKSHAARAIARPFEAMVIRTDVVRKELARSASLDQADLYSNDATRQTYARVLERAMDELEHGRTVIVDATFSQTQQRDMFIRAARDRGNPYVLIEITCEEATVRHRLRQRAADATEVSDADWQIYLAAKERFEAPMEIDEAHRLQIESGLTAEQTAAAVIEQILRIC